MTYVHPGRTFLARHGPVQDRAGVLAYVDFLRTAAGLGTTPPVYLDRIYAYFDMPHPKRALLPGQQGLLLDPERGLIIINASDPATRQRFTEAHELLELLFDGLPDSGHRKGVFRHTTKERLCNEGAAHLLMPGASFQPQVGAQGVSFATARALAEIYQVSPTAALVHMARLATTPAAVILWRMQYKPSDRHATIPAAQLSLLDNSPPPTPAKKLRIEWSLGSSTMPYLPTGKSAPAGSVIQRAWQQRTFTSARERLRLTAALDGTMYSENQPFEAEGEWQVLTLLLR